MRIFSQCISYSRFKGTLSEIDLLKTFYGMKLNFFLNYIIKSSPNDQTKFLFSSLVSMYTAFQTKKQRYIVSIFCL